MPSSNQNGIEEENKLQAVIIADTFNENFQPISAHIPSVLLTLVNSTCLDLTLQWLRRNLVNETIIYFKSKYISQFEESCKLWQTSKFQMKVKLIPLENMNSLGDVMRDLYAKSLVKSDFILLSGNVIGNLDFKKLVTIHKNQRKLYSTTVMSCVYLQYRQNYEKECYSTASRDFGKEHYSTATLLIHESSSRLLVHSRPPSTFVIPKKAMQMSMDGGCGLFTRMCDPNVLICSEILPSLFSDNFDYNTKDNLINGILGEEELMGYTINFINEEDGYCLNVDTFGAYEQMSIRLMDGAVRPLSVEKSQSTDRVRYKIMPFPLVYYSESASFDEDSVWEHVMIDAATTIHKGAKVQRCTIGKNCLVGDKTKIKYSFIQNNVNIRKNCFIEKCYIGDDVTILSGVTLEPGVIIGNNVTVGPNVTVPKTTRIVSTEYDNGFTKLNKNIIGEEGKGFIFEPDFSKDVYDCRWGLDLSIEKEIEEHAATAVDEEETDDESDHVEEVLSDEDNLEDFIREVKDSINNGLKEKSDPENIILEINASRHAYNVKLEDVQKIVVKIVLQAEESSGNEELYGDQLWQSVKQSLNSLSPVISNYIKKAKDQTIALVAIEELCKQSRYMSIVQFTLFELNQELEIFDDEVIVNWFNDYNEHTDVFPRIAKIIHTFISWLEDSDDEDQNNL